MCHIPPIAHDSRAYGPRGMLDVGDGIASKRSCETMVEPCSGKNLAGNVRQTRCAGTYNSRPRRQISIGCTTHDRQHNHGQSIRIETGDRTIRGLLQHSPPAILCSIRYAHPARRSGSRRAATRPTHRAHIPVQPTPNRSANQGPLGSGTIRKRPDLFFRQGDKHASRNMYLGLACHSMPGALARQSNNEFSTGTCVCGPELHGRPGLHQLPGG